MKKKNKQLENLLRANPIAVDARRKDELLVQLRAACDPLKEENSMKKRNLRRILIAAAVVGCLTMLVSAAVVGYLYSTPDGIIVDEAGNQVEEDNARTTHNSRYISGDGYHIRSVTWTMSNGRTTLAVWVTPDSDELVGLTAVIDGAEVPLEKKTFNLSSGLIGYTTTDVKEPTEFTLRCKSPVFEELVSFRPEDLIPAECTSNGITLFGTTAGSTVYIGVSDENYLTSEIFRHSELVFVKPVYETVTDNTGAQYGDSIGGTIRDDTMLMQMQYPDMPAGNIAVSLSAPYVKVVYSFNEAEEMGTAPSVMIPLPADGETVTGAWKLVDADGFSYIVDSITRSGEQLTFTTEGLTYEGIYDVAEDMPGNYVYTDLVGNGKRASTESGTNETWIIPANKGETLEDYADENGEILLTIWEMGVTYAGDWTLDFTADTVE